MAFDILKFLSAQGEAEEARRVARLGAVCPVCLIDLGDEVELEASDWSEGLPEQVTVECEGCHTVVEFACHWHSVLWNVESVGVAGGCEARYILSLRLVAWIEEALQNGTRHFRDRSGRLLQSLDEVVQAILSDNLREELS
jgi:hypothetical protein